MDVDLDGLFNHNSTYDYNTDYEYKEEVEPGSGGTVLVPLLCAVVLLLGLLGNGLLLYAVAQRWRSWRASDILVLHLSLADVLLLATLPFWAVEGATKAEICADGFFCRLSQVIFRINFFCGIFLLFFIGLDRYLSIIHSTELFSKKRPRLPHLVCLLVWLLSLVLTSPDWASTASRKDLHKSGAAHTRLSALLVSRVLHHALGFVLPAGALLLCCSCILLRLRFSSKGLLGNRSLVVFLPLVGLFLLCWTPYNVTLIVDTARFESGGAALHTALLITGGVACTHACLRPLLTFLLCGNFRSQTLASLQCGAVESRSSLWELGLGEEAPLPHERGQEPDELKQMNAEPRVEVQVQSDSEESTRLSPSDSEPCSPGPEGV